MTQDDDRRRILARRAALLGSALAALGCGPKSEARAPEPTGGVEVPKPVATDAPTPAKPPPRPENASPSGEMPPLLVPAGLDADVAARYERLNARVKSMHEILDAADGLVPSCEVADCEDKWRALAEKMHELRAIRNFMYTCPGSSDVAQKYMEYERAHLDAISQREAALQKRIEVAAPGKAGVERFAQLEHEAYSAKPYPCLSYACQDW